MGTDPQSSSRLPAAYLQPGSSSFTEFLAGVAPDLLPGHRTPPATAVGDQAPHGTTVVAAAYPDGIVMAGDRRATAGSMIAVRDVQKVFPADEYSAVGYAGSAGIGIEIVRLFQVELEHYQKIEGTTLSLDGKANRLSTLLRSNLGMALQGLAVLPLFAGYDHESGRGRIFSYDVTGGRYEEHTHHAIGSGSVFARGALKKFHRDAMDQSECIAACVQALYDAADDDSATGGPDIYRQIFPLVATVTDAGYHQVPEERVRDLVDRMLSGRREHPDGPTVPALDADGEDEDEGAAR